MFDWLGQLMGDFYGPPGQHVTRVLIALFLGGLVGLEREVRDKPAGFRTIILICVGACVFTIMSQALPGPVADPGRIAAQVVTGIGFLGAGAILRGGVSVYGLTTAATIWSVAAIGMAVGFGFMGLAVVGTLVMLVTLFGFDVIEEWIGQRRDIQEYFVRSATAADAVEHIDRLFKQYKLRLMKRFYYEDGTGFHFEIRAMGTKPDHERMRLTLARSDEFTLTKA